MQPSLENPYSKVPSSTLASQALINEDAGGVKMHSSSAAVTSDDAEEQSDTPAPLARRSSYNYEHDLAKYNYGAGDKAEEEARSEDNKERPANPRQKSFSMEDMKRSQYQQQFLVMTPSQQSTGFSEKS